MNLGEQETSSNTERLTGCWLRPLVRHFAKSNGIMSYGPLSKNRALNSFWSKFSLKITIYSSPSLSFFSILFTFLIYFFLTVAPFGSEPLSLFTTSSSEPKSKRRTGSKTHYIENLKLSQYLSLGNISRAKVDASSWVQNPIFHCFRMSYTSWLLREVEVIIGFVSVNLNRAKVTRSLLDDIKTKEL